MKTTLIVILSFISIGLFAQEKPNEKDAIKTVITNAYQEGLINEGNVEAAQKGFHEGFAILMKEGEDLNKFPIYNWVNLVELRKSKGQYPRKEKVKFEYLSIDITGNAASVKLDFYVGDVKTFTDYLLLYKYESGWRIVSKIYYEFPKEKTE